jgi:hypothetical protein
MKKYITPQIDEMELCAEGSMMLTQSGFDEKNNTENLTWDDYQEL